jgi:hypothetical protein
MKNGELKKKEDQKFIVRERKIRKMKGKMDQNRPFEVE